MDKAMELLGRDEFREFAHARDVFAEHLVCPVGIVYSVLSFILTPPRFPARTRDVYLCTVILTNASPYPQLGTFSILSAWGIPKEISRVGLFHTAYSGDLFIFHYFESESPEDRAELRAVIGTEAERLTHLFGTVRRQIINALVPGGSNMHRLADHTTQTKHNTTPQMDRSVVNRTLFAIPDDGETSATPPPLPLKARTIRTREGNMTISPEDQAAIMLVTIADYLDQMVAVNGWKDVHQKESPASLVSA